MLCADSRPIIVVHIIHFMSSPLCVLTQLTLSYTVIYIHRLYLVTNPVVQNTFIMYKIMQHHTVPYIVILHTMLGQLF